MKRNTENDQRKGGKEDVDRDRKVLPSEIEKEVLRSLRKNWGISS